MPARDAGNGKDFAVRTAPSLPQDPLIFGHQPDERLVAVEHAAGRDGDEMVLYFREGAGTVMKRERFEPFIVCADGVLANCPVPAVTSRLQGAGPLNVLALFPSWSACNKAKVWLAGSTGSAAAGADAPYLWLNDPVHQHLLRTGRTLFKGMAFGDLRRMQIDIECRTSPGYEFCNAERDGDCILAIGLGDQSGWEEIISLRGVSEKAMLERFVQVVRERDPDVLEGHNIFNFDLPYLFARARKHGVEMGLGRDGSTPASRSSRFSVGERTIAYERFDVFGRHVVDTMFLVNAYDISHRSLGGFGLKDAAVHFGVAAADRTYLEGSAIGSTFDRDPDRVLRYLADDVRETRALSGILSPSFFVQAQILPYSYQNTCVRGTAARIDALLLREYLREGWAVAMPGPAREFAGGYTDMFVEGVVQNVHHCDVRSLYPSLMLAHKIAPRSDDLGVFLRLLDRFRSFRLQAKAALRSAASSAERNDLDALQTTFKVLINSFYGYLGFSQARFCDFDAAEEVTRRGRDVLTGMIEWLRAHGAKPIEIDTDGIYFVPPDGAGAGQMDAFRAGLAAALPEGIEVEFDGEYASMYSYKMKNYALLDRGGEIVIKGAALKSRGLEPFQRDCLREIIRLKLEGRDSEIPELRRRYEKALRGREWPVQQFAKTERLQESPAAYESKRARGKCAKDAAYELALRAARTYRAGDQVSFYVTGEKKNVTVHGAAKLVSEWDPARRDENVEYYMAKLQALFEKFVPAVRHQELQLGF